MLANKIADCFTLQKHTNPARLGASPFLYLSEHGHVIVDSWWTQWTTDITSTVVPVRIFHFCLLALRVLRNRRSLICGYTNTKPRNWTARGSLWFGGGFSVMRNSDDRLLKGFTGDGPAREREKQKFMECEIECVLTGQVCGFNRAISNQL